MIMMPIQVLKKISLFSMSSVPLLVDKTTPALSLDFAQWDKYFRLHIYIYSIAQNMWCHTHIFACVRFKCLGIIIIQLFDFVQLSEQHSKLLITDWLPNANMQIMIKLFLLVSMMSLLCLMMMTTFYPPWFFSAVLLLLWKLLFLLALHS